MGMFDGIMGNGLVKSGLGLFGMGDDSGTQVPMQTGNQSLQDFAAQNTKNTDDLARLNDSGFTGGLQSYAKGNMSSQDFLGKYGNDQSEMNNFATNPISGSKFATEQVQGNPLMSQYFGSGPDSLTSNYKGQLNNQEGQLDKLQNQGFQLTPEDQTMYGQASGNIARQFGQQGNDIQQQLAQRGLSSAPSGAAGGAFSGLAGNQNEMLAQAQQQIMQQRFQNTMQQIGQQQQFVNQLMGQNSGLAQQGQNAIEGQFGRQQAGVQNYQNQNQLATQGLASAAGAQNTANANANNANLNAASFANSTKPTNLIDMTTGLVGGKGASQLMGGGGGGGGMGAGGGGMAGMAGLM